MTEPPPNSYSRGYPREQPYYYASYYGGTEAPGVAHAEPIHVVALRIIRRKWLTILIAGLLGLLGGVCRLRQITPMYRANATIEMTVRRPRILNMQEAVRDESYNSSEILSTRLAKFKGVAMAELAAKELEAIQGDDFDKKRSTASRLLGGVSFVRRDGTRLVTVSFSDTVPEFAADAANAYARASEVFMLNENRSSSDGAVAWLEEQSKSQATKLAESEHELSTYRSANNIDVIEGERESVQASILTLTSSAASLESRSLNLFELRKTIDALPEVPDAETVAGLPTELPQREQIAAALERLVKAIAELEELRKRYTDEHPDILQRTGQIEGLRAQLANEVDAARNTIGNDLQLVERQLAALRKTIAEKRELAAELERDIVAKMAQLRTIERTRDACALTYNSILTRIEEARLSADENTAVVKVLEQASVPGSPFSPQPGKIIAMAALIGLLCGGMLAFVTVILDDRISSLIEIERTMGFKVISVIPHATAAERKDLALATLDRKFSHLNECFAGIRSLLDSPQYRDVSKSILIASDRPEAGKTITCCNLAIASARSGKKTLLVDFDMRRPRLRGIFTTLNRDESLLHVLAAEETEKFELLPAETQCPNLFVITSHPSKTISPSETLGGSAVQKFFKWATENFDRVVIDSPPCGLVSDAAVLGSMTGCTLLVCRAKTSRKRGVRHALDTLVDRGANVIGIIVNDITPSKINDVGYRYYPYAYQQKYGEYMSNSENKEDKG